MNPKESNNKRIARNTLILYLRMFFMMTISLFTSRILLSALGIENYGVYNVVGGVVSMLAFFNGSMSVSTQRFLNVQMAKGDKTKLNEVFVNAVNVHALIGIITVVALETVGLWFIYHKLVASSADMGTVLWVFHFSVASLFLSIISTPYNASIIANEKMQIYAYMSLVEVMGKLLLIYLLLAIDTNHRLFSYAFMMFLIATAMRLMVGWYCRRYFEECRYEFRVNLLLSKQLLSFSSWLVLGILSDMLSSQGVNILINLFFGPIYNAARGIAVQVNNAVNTFVNNFLTAVRPQIIKSYAASDFDYLYTLVFSASKLSYYLLLMLILPVLFNTQFLLEIWLKEVPPYCAIFTQLTLVEFLIRSIYSPIGYLNQASGKIKYYQLSISLLFIGHFALSYLAFLGGYPVYIVFIIAVIIAIVGLFVRLAVMKRVNQFPILNYMKRVCARILIVTMLSLPFPLVWYYLRGNEGFTGLVVMSSICVISALLSIWTVGLDATERSFVISKVWAVINRAKMKIGATT